MKRSSASFKYVVIFILIVLLTGALLFVATKVNTAAPPPPTKQIAAEQTCKDRMAYDAQLQKCTSLLGKQEEDCRSDLEKEYNNCVRLERIRNADSIEEALEIEKTYLGRELTSDEALRVTAETMFDEYKLRGTVP